ncbi:MAG: response regulator [Clostridiaceae bacterium]|nr:response regulator [Clostridiaceae bacterium]
MIKLMIVDDEKTTREGLMEYIPWKELGIDMVEEAEDGLKALELAMKFNPDIVLTDVRMPKMNGINLAEQLKLKLPKCKVLFLSGHTDKEYLKSAITLGAINYIEKPVDIEEVKRVISYTVQLCKKEKEQELREIGLVNKVTESIPLLIEKLCLELIAPSPPVDLIERLSFLYLPYLEKDFFITVLVKLNFANNSIPEINPEKKEVILKKISQLVEENEAYSLCGFKERDYIIIHIYGGLIKNTPLFNSLLNTIKLNLEQLLQLENRLFIAVGEMVYQFKDLHKSYKTSVITVQKQFFLGYDKILFFTMEKSDFYDFSKQNQQVFFDLIIAGRKSEAELFIKNIVNELRYNTNTLINNIKNYFFNLLVGITKIAQDRNIAIVESNRKEEFFWEEISKANTIYEIEDYILNKINTFFEILAHKKNNNSIVLSITKYIHNNYSNNDLTIKDIAAYTFLTPNYLCLVFKKETGKTINQFITEIRIEKAKELLKDRQIKLYEIASLIGFSDANYFAKTFKKLEGINPSDFREKYFL